VHIIGQVLHLVGQLDHSLIALFCVVFQALLGSGDALTGFTIWSFHLLFCVFHAFKQIISIT